MELAASETIVLAEPSIFINLIVLPFLFTPILWRILLFIRSQRRAKSDFTIAIEKILTAPFLLLCAGVIGVWIWADCRLFRGAILTKDSIRLTYSWPRPDVTLAFSDIKEVITTTRQARRGNRALRSLLIKTKDTVFTGCSLEIGYCAPIEIIAERCRERTNQRTLPPPK